MMKTSLPDVDDALRGFMACHTVGCDAHAAHWTPHDISPTEADTAATLGDIRDNWRQDLGLWMGACGRAVPGC